jgi:ubiquinone/menaquinone biosynthesis C-methylase UbiE
LGGGSAVAAGATVALHELPLEDGHCDTAVASLVLCSVPDPPGALAELRRVLRSGGQLRFFEHIRSEHPAQARVQTWLDRCGVWPRIGGGCHCARDTVAAIKVAGFHIERLEHVTIGPAWGVTNPYVVGIAT